MCKLVQCYLLMYLYAFSVWLVTLFTDIIVLLYFSHYSKVNRLFILWAKLLFNTYKYWKFVLVLFELLLFNKLLFLIRFSLLIHFWEFNIGTMGVVLWILEFWTGYSWINRGFFSLFHCSNIIFTSGFFVSLAVTLNFTYFYSLIKQTGMQLIFTWVCDLTNIKFGAIYSSGYIFKWH